MIVLPVSSIIGQNQIKGKISDATGNPLEYVNVVLLTQNDSTYITGAVSDTLGFFEIQYPEGRSVILRCSFIGYEDYYKEVIPSIVSHNIQMNYSSLILDEVTIIGSKKIFSIKNGNLTMDVQNTLLRSIGNGIDVLKRLPSVITDSDDNITVIGKGNPLIYIDDREVYDKAELQRLNSNDIQNVEYLGTPGAQYDGEIKAVIRITTKKKNEEEGFSFRGRINGSQGEKFSNNATLDFGYKIGKMDFRLSVFDYHSRKKSTGYYNTVMYGDTVWTMKDYSKGNSNYRYNDLTANIYYEINNKHNINVLFNYYNGISKSNNQNTMNVFSDHNRYDDVFYSSLVNDKSNNNRSNISYMGELNNKMKLEVNVDYFNKKTVLDQYNNEISDKVNRKVESNSETKYTIYASKVRLNYSISQNFFITPGIDVFHTRRDGYFNNKQNILPSTKTRVSEQRNSFYVDLNFNVNNLSIITGLRYELYNNKQIDKSGNINEVLLDKSYNHFLPSISISYPINKIQMSLSLYRKTKRPTYFQLREGIQYNGRFEYEKGNPFLLPEKITTVSLSGSWRNLMLSVAHNRIDDHIGFMFYQAENNSSIKIASPINYNKLTDFTFSAHYSQRIGIWTPQVSLNCIVQDFKMQYLDRKINLNNPYFIGKFNNDFQTKSGYIFSLELMGNTPGNIGESYLYKQFSANISARKSFFEKRLDISLIVNDIFKTVKRHSSNQIGFVYYNRDQFNDTRYISLSLVYKFNNYKSSRRSSMAGDEEIRRTY